MAALCLGVLCATVTGRVIYVDDDANGANDGSSWADAYKYLQDALADANFSEKPVEVRVAEGTYKPDCGNGVTRGDLKATFNLVNGVTIRGGYAGIKGSDPNARGIKAHVTLLSGDLDGNDVGMDDGTYAFDRPSRTDNSYRVVTATQVDPNTQLDGLVISGASEHFFYDVPYYKEAGLYADYKANLAIRDCIFTNNAGPGMFCSGSNPVLMGCVFVNNHAPWSGAGLSIRGGSLSLIGCTFDRNWSGSDTGGGVDSFGSRLWLEDCIFTNNMGSGACDTLGGGLVGWAGPGSLVLRRCMFVGNSGWTGGAVYFTSGEATIIDCTFSRNQSGDAGGAIFAHVIKVSNCVFEQNSSAWGGAVAGGTMDLSNCIFAGNYATREGAALYAPYTYSQVGSNQRDSHFIINLSNCTFRGNSAPKGRALACRTSALAPEGTVNVSNCILNDAGNEIHNLNGVQMTIAYTNLQGGVGSIYDPCGSVSWGAGNIDVDPCFADPGYWDPNGTPDDPNDDFWINGDYHLKSQAGRWDPNSQTWVKDGVTSPCIDAGDPVSPIGLEPFPNGGRINMGAYGGTAEASKSYFGEPVCETIMAGDINGDCKIDFEDLAIFALHWLQ